MTNLRVNSTAPAGLEGDLDGDLAALRGDCARMAPHWMAPEHADPRPVPPSFIHGVTVPVRSARLLDAMSDYGD
ncbi:hypothetical protein LK07_08760 [Streptomyces pluripotens]|uniref:Uncharacterized protein n=1 Tax=Streptomyces pluripotens TaxID=1355015 RepID=A0A221NVW6_9ACTN|nr:MULTISPECIES: hypothetical protein [Streptomyces]ARP69854.1 hypothetical protein LK06_007655 [Streptomyces pluripotens]ASN24111.1 hypothetical protein LK07_08760 [Streptomyces pluripotens]KIE24022.1 hypothetical protein LK08_25915 [Streptomyces sp. MUSC 125]MCH0555637.1 hypothetical protein [Streptomyces sp. MUM 16J]